MALQTIKNLGMVGIGVQGDIPLSPMQPSLIDGIHLRWGFKRELGFPWYGFYLFRRKHIPGDYLCLSQVMAGQPTETPLGTTIDTNYGRVESDKSLVLKAAVPPLPLGLDLNNRNYIRFSLYPGQLARKMKVSIQFPESEIEGLIIEIPIAFMHQNTILFETSAVGCSGAISGTAIIEGEFDAIDAVQIGAGQAFLIDLCFVPVSQDAGIGWEVMPGFSYPMGLPVSDPSYPPNSNQENLSTARNLARNRVKYGDPSRVIPQEVPIVTSGSIRISKDLPLVSGVGTNWNDDIVGGMLQGERDRNARTIVAVIAPDKLVLSRNYQGVSGSNRSYRINMDPFGQMHDLLEVLVHGGRASGPMVNRSMSTIIDSLWGIHLVQGSSVVTGLGTNWTKELEGLALQVIRPSNGTVTVRNGYPFVEIADSSWSANMVGQTFKLAEGDIGYTIAGVISPKLMMLDLPYIGDTWLGKAYSIIEGPFYSISKVNSPTEMVLDRGYSGVTEKSGVDRWYTIIAGSQPRETETPMISSQHPLDLILFASLDPAIAQILGLYWVDRAVDPNTCYDYMIVAYYGREVSEPPAPTPPPEEFFAFDSATVSESPSPDNLLRQIRSMNLGYLEAFITFKKCLNNTPAPLPPRDPRIYVLPGGNPITQHQSLQRSSALPGSPGEIEIGESAANNAGLYWDATEKGQSPQQAVMYHIWRADLGPTEPQGPPTDSSYKLITKDAPVIVAEPELAPGSNPERPKDWPPFPMTAFDRDLPDGWYSYRISSVDIFGRHSVMSAPAVWHQWSPAPEPKPYYYQDPPEDKAIHPFAVHLLDKTSPPMPTGIEAYALSPDDPFVLKDAAYEAWRNSLNPADRDTVIGLRVRWQWTQAHMSQAPDTREFRIYYQPGRLNSILGHTLKVSRVGDTESSVETDIPNSLPSRSNVYASTWLRIDQDAFEVMKSDFASPVILSRVKNIGPKDDIQPQANMPCTIIIPPIYAAGTVSTVRGSEVVYGTRTDWTPNLVGRYFRIRGDIEEYGVTSVDSLGQFLILDRSYSGISKNDRDYVITHPLFTDYTAAESWSERIFVVSYDEHVTVTTDKLDGRPLREYEVFLPMPHTAEGDSFGTTQERPIAYAQIGISAADNAAYSPDDPGRPVQEWGGRPGNEGRIGPPAQIFRVNREKPTRPEPPVEPEMAYASPADYYGLSFYTYRWKPRAGMKVHVFRALDDALFNFDWQRISGSGSGSRQPSIDPNETNQTKSPFPSDWTPARRKAAADQLNDIASLDDYQRLSNDALRVLASLPENERAFVQVTVSTLDPGDPANANRRGPDNKEGFVVDLGLRAYVDAMEGRSVNRYFYCAAYVNGAQNSSTLSISGPPVYLQDVVPPRAPVITKVLGDDRKIIIKWASNREADLKEYRIYRADSEENAHRLDLMMQVHVVSESHDPSVRPAEMTWPDETAPSLVNIYYRVVAVDMANNISAPSMIAVGRAIDNLSPDPPTWNSPSPGSTSNSIRLSWVSPNAELACLVQRRQAGSQSWVNISGWFPRGTYAFIDEGRAAGIAYDYRLKVLDTHGRQNKNFNVLTV